MKKLILFACLLFSIHCVASLSISPATIINGYAQHPYSQTLSSTGTKPFVWTLTGSLPSGLGFQPNSTNIVTISGTPTTVGVSTFSISATDKNGTTGITAYTVTVSYNYLTVNDMTSLWSRSVPVAPYGFDTWNSLINVTSTPTLHAGTGISISGSNPSFTVTNTGATTIIAGSGVSINKSGTTYTVTNSNVGVGSITVTTNSISTTIDNAFTDVAFNAADYTTGTGTWTVTSTSTNRFKKNGKTCIWEFYTQASSTGGTPSTLRIKYPPNCTPASLVFFNAVFVYDGGGAGVVSDQYLQTGNGSTYAEISKYTGSFPNNAGAFNVSFCITYDTQ